MKTIYKDLSSDYIPFLIQCNKTSGAVENPTVDNLIVSSLGGSSTSFSLSQITGSPFDPIQINSKTGLWGAMIPKTSLSVNNFYLFLWEMTIDGIATAKAEKVFVCDAQAFKLKQTKVYTVTLDSVGLAGVKVRCSADINGNDVICFGVTNSDGEVTFYLEAGTYYMWCFKSGYTFTNPDIEVVI